MKVAILHYHLRTSGVTTVIRNAQRALCGRYDVSVLADFGYHDKPAASRQAFMTESQQLMAALAERLQGVELLHTHNIGLGKNPRLTCAVKMLAASGTVKVLNQVHDFPEDNRPSQLHALRYCTGARDDAFMREMCYYDLPNVLWATLTTHDADKLAGCGIPCDKIHLLPNPVDDFAFCRPTPSQGQLREVQEKLANFAREHRFDYDPRRKLLLSPMKVMVRKNNAEAVELVKRLNSRRGKSDYQLLISLDAASPADRAYSEKLKRKIRRERLPVVIGFGREVGDPLPLFHLAHAILTTSKSEGFGYTFVEGWLCGKMVVGRDIPEVTSDFVGEGMRFDHLYSQFGDSAEGGIAALLKSPPRQLIEHNRRIVLQKYSLKAYARRFGSLLRRFPDATRAAL